MWVKYQLLCIRNIRNAEKLNLENKQINRIRNPQRDRKTVCMQGSIATASSINGDENGEEVNGE